MNKRPDPERVDAENPEWSDKDFKRAVPFTGLSESLQAKLRLNRGGRGPQKTPTKERITIRLSPDVVESFRATGSGWQARVDAALKNWLETHSPL